MILFTPKEFIEAGRSTARSIGSMVGVGQQAINLSRRAVYKLWNVSVGIVKSPFIAVGSLFFARSTDVSVPVLTPVVERSVATVDSSSLENPVENAFASEARGRESESTDFSSGSFDASDESSGDESDSDGMNISVYHSLVNRQSPFQSLRPLPRKRARTSTLSHKEMGDFCRSFKVTKTHLNKEIAAYNRSIRADEQDLSEQGVIFKRNTLGDECELDSDEAPHAIAKVLESLSGHVPESSISILEFYKVKDPEQSLRMITRSANISAKRNRSGMAKALDITHSGSPLLVLLKNTSLPASEYQECAAALVRHLDGRACRVKQLNKIFSDFIATYQSRTHRLVPALARYADGKGIARSQPMGVEDLDRLGASNRLFIGDDQSSFRRFSAFVVKAHDLCYSPVHGVDANSYYDQAQAAKGLLQELAELKSQHAGALMECLQSDLETMKHKLNMRVKLAETILESDERKCSNTLAQAEAWEEDVIGVIDELEQDYLAWAKRKAKGLSRIQNNIHNKSVANRRRQYNKARGTVAFARDALREDMKALKDAFSSLCQETRRASCDSAGAGKYGCTRYGAVDRSTCVKFDCGHQEASGWA